MEQRQKEYISQSKDQEQVGGNDDKNGESNHDGLLQINERQFYDNLLVSAHCKYAFDMKLIKILISYFLPQLSIQIFAPHLGPSQEHS